MRQLYSYKVEILADFKFNGLFLPPFSRLDVPLYASRLEERRFLPKSDYPLKKGFLKFAFEKALKLYFTVLLLHQ